MLFQFEGVTKTYGAVTALNNLSLAVPEGAVGLLGPNGSGKTTMIRTLLGLIPVDAGTGQVLGKDFRTQQLDIRREVGFAPEDECLFPHVVGVDFVAYAGELGGMHRKDALQRAHETLDYVGLGEAHYRKVESYSTGMKQRLKLASAIVHDPKMLILDEPTNGMDPAGRQEILELARDLTHNKGMSLLFSSHLLPDVEAVCDYVIVLASGKLLAEGKIQELKQVHRQSYEVRVKSAQSQFALRLADAGCTTTEGDDDVLRVQLPENESPQLLWRAAAEANEQIRYLRPQRSTLEEVFLNAVEQVEMPVFDQGYQHWSGTLAAHPWRWLAITRHGVRVALTNRWVKLALIVSLAPAFALAAMLCVWGLLEQKSSLIVSIAPLLGFLDKAMILDPHTHRLTIWTLSYSYFMKTELWFSMLLILMIGPNLISQDLRYNALPLYLSRPIRRFDYFLGKLGVIVAFLCAVTVIPAIIAYILGLLFSLDLTILRDTFHLLLASIAYGLVISVSAGMLILALSSLSRNSRYIALFWLGVWLGATMVSGVLQGADQHHRMRQTMHNGGQWGDDAYVESTLEASRRDWRPLVSYTSNLARVGDAMLGTNASWEKVGELKKGPARNFLLLTRLGPQYPWTWSAAVLIGLFVLSALILNSSIKSLDRLK